MEENFECNLCGNQSGNRIPFRYKFKDRYLWAVKCTNCELVSIWPRPSAEEITEMYADDYFVGSDNKTHHMDVAYVDLLSSGDYQKGVEEIRAHCQTGNILDIGCATGNFLYALKQNGFQVKGIELSKFAAEFGRDKFGIDIINKPFDENLLGKELNENYFDVILMGDVLEHFTNPTAACELTAKILKPGGKAIIHLPGTLNLISSRLAFFIYRLFGSQKTMYIPPYHLTEFTAETATKMLKKSGFSRIEIKQEIKHPNSIPLRGNMIENAVKYSLQFVNYFLTKSFGVAGDRIQIEAYK